LLLNDNNSIEVCAPNINAAFPFNLSKARAFDAEARDGSEINFGHVRELFNRRGDFISVLGESGSGRGWHGFCLMQSRRIFSGSDHLLIQVILGSRSRKGWRPTVCSTGGRSLSHRWSGSSTSNGCLSCGESSIIQWWRRNALLRKTWSWCLLWSRTIKAPETKLGLFQRLGIDSQLHHIGTQMRLG